jgi:hypothetical protein
MALCTFAFRQVVGSMFFTVASLPLGIMILSPCFFIRQRMKKQPEATNTKRKRRERNIEIPDQVRDGEGAKMIEPLL